MNRLTTLTVLLTILLSLSSCSLLRTVLPGGPTLANAQWDGVKSGEAISILGTLDPRAEATITLLQALGQYDPLGVLIPLTPIGQTLPRWVICKGDMATKCKLIPLQAEVHFSGNVIGSGPLWEATFITARHTDD